MHEKNFIFPHLVWWLIKDQSSRTLGNEINGLELTKKDTTRYGKMKDGNFGLRL